MKKYVYELMTDQRRGIVASVIKTALFVFSILYAAVVSLTRTLYSWKILPSYKSPKTVISIGNITVGGTGKTPLVITVFNALRSAGLHPVVVSRGYMAGADAQSDETQMMKEVLNDTLILTGANRSQSIRIALSTIHVDAFVCDDAFQHWPLQRDLDIVTVDALNPFGNGCVLPRGILREPVSALKRADVVVITRTERNPGGILDLRRRLAQINPKLLVVESVHQLLGFTEVFGGVFAGLDVVRGKKVIAFCAIADPESFEGSLVQAGADVVKRFDFMDHHVYSIEDLKGVRDFCVQNEIGILVTTHKDAVKIQNFDGLWGSIKVLRLNIGVTITHGNEPFIERILSACHP